MAKKSKARQQSYDNLLIQTGERSDEKSDSKLRSSAQKAKENNTILTKVPLF